MKKKTQAVFNGYLNLSPKQKDKLRKKISEEAERIKKRCYRNSDGRSWPDTRRMSVLWKMTHDKQRSRAIHRIIAYICAAES